MGARVPHINFLGRKVSACEILCNTTFDNKISTRNACDVIYFNFSQIILETIRLCWHGIQILKDEVLHNTCLHSTTQNDCRKHRLRNESNFNSDTDVENISQKWRGSISDLMEKCYLTVSSICQRRRKKKRETLIQATTPYLISHKWPRFTIRQNFPLKQIKGCSIGKNIHFLTAGCLVPGYQRLREAQ